MGDGALGRWGRWVIECNGLPLGLILQGGLKGTTQIVDNYLPDGR